MKAAELFDMNGEVALVTGASSGLGARFARVLAANGAKVVALARRADRLAALVGEIEAAGGTALAVEADVADRAAMQRAFDAAEAAFGTVGVLINNAGLARPGRALDLPEADWRATMDVNLDAVWRTAQIAAQRMVAAGRPGAIVNTASIAAFVVERGLSAYAVSKAAVAQLTRALALELGPKGVRVNAIAPGYIVTEINEAFLTGEAGQRMAKKIPLGRIGETGDLDGVLLLLASRAGRWINGAIYTVDGGHNLVGA
ncbi:MAG: SDR family oxidoreductase [Methylobacteriaceae bacterium]|nr:SDR family oxidoreductase [Methylobacteriaceae bacterium]